MNISRHYIPVIRIWPITVLVIIIACNVFVTGCTSTIAPLSDVTEVTRPTVNYSWQNNTPATVSIQPVPDLFISTESVMNRRAGEVITFRGTTNLRQGEGISISITNENFRHCPKSSRDCSDSVDFCCGGISRNVTVQAGDNCLGMFSWEVNTSQHEFSQDSYAYVAFSVSTPNVSNGTQFVLI